jgi:single-strand DNA-binding protein
VSGVNKVILLGRLGKDPETRNVGDSSVTSFSLATSEKWTDKRSGEIKEKVQWHEISAWGRVGEIAAEYLSKGREVYIEGTLDYQSWDKKDGGGKGYKTVVKVLSLQLLSSGDYEGERETEPEHSPPARGNAVSSGLGAASRQDGTGGARGGRGDSGRTGVERSQPRNTDFDDDIPF